TLVNRYTARFQPFDLFGVIGQQFYSRDIEQLQHPSSGREIPRINGKAKTLVGVDRVKSLILQGIGAQFVDKADAASFLPQIEQNAPGGRCNTGEGGV